MERSKYGQLKMMNEINNVLITTPFSVLVRFSDGETAPSLFNYIDK